MTLTDYVSRKEKGKGLASVDALIQRLEGYIKKARRKIDFNRQKQYRQDKHQKNKNNQKTKNGKKNNCMDISSDK